MKDIPVPATLGELLTIALRDLQAVEADPSYEVSMRAWVLPCDQAPCNVCLAGAVMAKSLDAVPDVVALKRFPSDNVLDLFSLRWQDAFRALDALRSGRLRFAIDRFYRGVQEKKALSTHFGWEVKDSVRRFVDIPDGELAFMRKYSDSLDRVRLGDWGAGEELSYHLNKEKWWQTMRQIEALFLKHGI